MLSCASTKHRDTSKVSSYACPVEETWVLRGAKQTFPYLSCPSVGKHRGLDLELADLVPCLVFLRGLEPRLGELVCV